MATAYLNSKMIDGLEVTSSGVGATKDKNGPIVWLAQRIIENNKLVPFETTSWTQTTKEILSRQDLIVFMQKWHYDQCVQRFGFKGKNYEIWDVEDIETGNEPDSVKIPHSEAIFRKITDAIDNLISRNFVPKDF